MLAVTVMRTVSAALGTVHHGVGTVNNQNHGTGIGHGSGGGTGFNTQGNIEYVFLTGNGFRSLGKGNIGSVHIIGNGAGAAFGPDAIDVGTVNGGSLCAIVFRGESGQRGAGQKHADGEHDAQDFLHFTIHDLYLLLK
jgi:hypothetical protein